MGGSLSHSLTAALATASSSASPFAAAAAAGGLPPVIWYAPFLSGGGYCSEATAFVLGLRADGVDVQIVQHGDAYNPEYMSGLPVAVRDALGDMQRRRVDPTRAVAVCHSEPGAWHPPAWPTSRCPPPGAKHSVGRTMFETDRIPDKWDARLNRMDEIWVPSEFNRRTFAAGGAARSKLRVLGEPVDTAFYSRDRLSAQGLPPFQFPPPPPPPPSGGGNYEAAADSANAAATAPTKFLSVFKWEQRKGWDVLLEAYLHEFSRADGVALFILTTSFHQDISHQGDKTFANEIQKFTDRFPTLQRKRDAGDLPPVQVLPWLRHDDMPRLYAAVQALVQPSRGEGWGRPHAEAMAMGLPVVATNWSGNTEFMTDENSYLIEPEEELVLVGEGAFRDHKWAQPKAAHLRQILRHIREHPDEARSRGLHGQTLMRERYSPARMSAEVRQMLARLARTGTAGDEETESSPEL